MSIFRRNKARKKLQRVADKVGGAVVAASSAKIAKAAVGTVAGVTTLTAASAVVSAARRKSES